MPADMFPPRGKFIVFRGSHWSAGGLASTPKSIYSTQGVTLERRRVSFHPEEKIYSMQGLTLERRRISFHPEGNLRRAGDHIETPAD